MSKRIKKKRQRQNGRRDEVVVEKGAKAVSEPSGVPKASRVPKASSNSHDLQEKLDFTTEDVSSDAHLLNKVAQ